MFKTKEWFQACVAGIVFSLAYNILYLHTSVDEAFIKSVVIACEANLILFIYLKICEFLFT